MQYFAQTPQITAIGIQHRAAVHWEPQRLEVVMITPKVAQSAAHVAHHYDELDPFYRALRGEHMHHGLWVEGDETVAEAALKLLEVVAARAQLRLGTTIYDVGAGYGTTSR